MSRILVVDDEDIIRKYLQLTLEQLGYVVMVACNGQEALAHLQRESVDLILTDLIMPEKEGMETIEEVRKLYPKIKIIAMSGGGRIDAFDYLRVAKKMGADLVMEKPFSNRELTAALDQLLPKDSPHSP